MIIPKSLIVSLIGSSLIVISVFLPWISTTYSIPEIGPITGLASGVEDNLGQLIMLNGLASIGILFVNQKSFRVKFGLLLAVINLCVIIYFILRFSAFQFPRIYTIQQDIQFGLYITIIGTLTLIVGKIIEYKTNKKEIKPPKDLVQ